MKKDNKVLWLTLVLILIGMFLIASVFASEEEVKKIQTNQNYVSQNYKTYESDWVLDKNVNSKSTPYYSDKDYKKIYSYERENDNYERRPVDRIYYSQYNTEKSRKGFLGDYVKEYSVYVKNKGRTGRYFTVVFEFEDKNGYEFSQAVTQYLRTGENKKFVYKDIQYERNEILDWDYRIIPRNY